MKNEENKDQACYLNLGDAIVFSDSGLQDSGTTMDGENRSQTERAKATRVSDLKSDSEERKLWSIEDLEDWPHGRPNSLLDLKSSTSSQGMVGAQVLKNQNVPCQKISRGCCICIVLFSVC